MMLRTIFLSFLLKLFLSRYLFYFNIILSYIQKISSFFNSFIIFFSSQVFIAKHLLNIFSSRSQFQEGTQYSLNLLILTLIALHSSTHANICNSALEENPHLLSEVQKLHQLLEYFITNAMQH